MPLLQFLEDNLQRLLGIINGGSNEKAYKALWKAHRVVIAVRCLATLLLTALQLQVLAATSWLLMDLCTCLSI